jgi:hypothetical protein
MQADPLFQGGFAITYPDFQSNLRATVLDFVGFWPESIHLERGFR